MALRLALAFSIAAVIALYVEIDNVRKIERAHQRALNAIGNSIDNMIEWQTLFARKLEGVEWDLYKDGRVTRSEPPAMPPYSEASADG